MLTLNTGNDENSDNRSFLSKSRMSDENDETMNQTLNIDNADQSFDFKSYFWKPIEEFDRDYYLGKLISKTPKGEHRFCEHIKLSE